MLARAQRHGPQSGAGRVENSIEAFFFFFNVLGSSFCLVVSEFFLCFVFVVSRFFPLLVFCSFLVWGCTKSLSFLLPWQGVLKQDKVAKRGLGRHGDTADGQMHEALLLVDEFLHHFGWLMKPSKC